MADWWNDFGDFSLGGGDTLDTGSFNPTDYSGFSLGGSGGGGFDFGNFAPQQTGETPFTLGSGGFGAGSGSPLNFDFNPAQGAQGLGGLLGAVGGLPGALGLAGGAAGIIGKLMGGGAGATTQPVQNNAAKGAQASANSMLGTAAQGNLPLQQMQMSLLEALANGQGLPPGYAQLIEQAFQPQLGDLYTQAANQGRARGFHDAPATSPPGGAILGPGLANIQGQQAAAKLGLMQSLPGLYNAPIGQQLSATNSAATGLQNTAAANTGSQTSQPLGPQIGQAIGAGLQGLGQSMQQQQNPFQQSLQNLMNSGMGITLSGARQ